MTKDEDLALFAEAMAVYAGWRPVMIKGVPMLRSPEGSKHDVYSNGPPYDTDGNLALGWAEGWCNAEPGRWFRHAYESTDLVLFRFAGQDRWSKGSTRARAICRAAAKLPEVQEIMRNARNTRNE